MDERLVVVVGYDRARLLDIACVTSTLVAVNWGANPPCRVRLAVHTSALSTIMPKAAATLAQAHPGLELSLLGRVVVGERVLSVHGCSCRPDWFTWCWEPPETCR
jgi:DNA-binding transcriptional LysR family regulator